LNLLKFRIDDFKSEKTAGRTATEVTFTVNVFVRFGPDAGLIASIPVEMDVVKGPDQMWYLTKGTL
jgi:hypothetical protein